MRDTTPIGELRAVTKVDPVTGFKEVRFYGRQSFIADFCRRGRRVTSFRTEHGYVDASGRRLR
jgi:hypothetical protein